jgi:hypothetical protein
MSSSSASFLRSSLEGAAWRRKRDIDSLYVRAHLADHRVRVIRLPGSREWTPNQGFDRPLSKAEVLAKASPLIQRS